ncbi:MAG: Ldh family oxidoreductase [Desulfovibrio sp.]|jgi:(2R)-3-sulfolactate dehydrogenase (NADP+)|nr:Ldh family oxidoreductase [Desulfovibrio sp.]
MSVLISASDLRALGLAVLGAAGTPAFAASAVVDALLAAELEGISSHGFSRLPAYADQARSGKVKAGAEVRLTVQAPSVLMVDAGNGFAFPAIAKGIEAAMVRAREQGLCALGVRRSHHCGVLGFFMEKIAAGGLIGLACTNSPAAMAPWGGKKAVFGTNPLAFGCPRARGEALIIDLSLSKAARGKVMLAGQRGESIPADWALDAEGRETTDPQAALRGTMLPLGGAKGAALALMVEILAATLTGSNHASEASSFFDATGPAPGVGQFFLLIDPGPFNPDFLSRLEALCAEILEQGNTRLPGDRRRAEREKRLRAGISLPEDLLTDLRTRAGEY